MKIECSNAVKDAVETAINGALCRIPCDAQQGKGVESCVTATLFGSKKIRLGSCDDNQRAYMERLVKRYTNTGAPIAMTGMWGAIKAYGKDHNRCGMDIYDAMAVQRLAGVAAEVKRFYTPGVQITIIPEDISEVVMGTVKGEQLATMIDRYATVLGKYATAHSDSVTFVTESSLLAASGKTADDFLAMGERFGNQIFAYWEASSQHPEADWESLTEYKELNEIGWKGVIPSVMRQHYIDRIGSEYSDSDNAFRARLACRYLGGALARYRIGMISNNLHDAEGLIPALKCGFGTMAPGVDKRMLMGRLDYKVKANKKSHTTTPPWCGFGVLERRESGLEPTILGVRAGAFTTEPVYVHSNGVCFRADILQN